MMTFKMDTGGALAAGQGVGNAIKALAMGQATREKAEQEGFANAARVGSSMASARKATADAELSENRLRFAQNPMESAVLEQGLPTSLAPAFKDRLSTGQWGGEYAPPELDGVGPFKPAPADDDTVAKLGQTISLLQRMLATGSNAEQYSDAALKDQKRRNIERVMSNPSLAGSVGLANAANDGKPLFNAVGNTGVSLNQFTGDQAQVNDVLAKLFGNESKAKTNKDNAAASKSSAEALMEKAKLSHFNDTGALPGTKQSKDESFNVGQIRDDIRADYNVIWSAGSTGFRPKEAPTYEEFSRQWLKQYNIPESVLYGGGAAQASGPASMPPETKTVGGKTYVKVNGQWFE